MASRMVMLSTETVNLHCFGFAVPSLASCEREAAPSQYQMRRALCKVTSLPLCATSVPNSTPLRSPRIMTFFPMFVSISLFVFVVATTFSGNCDCCFFINSQKSASVCCIATDANFLRRTLCYDLDYCIFCNGQVFVLLHSRATLSLYSQSSMQLHHLLA